MEGTTGSLTALRNSGYSDNIGDYVVAPMVANGKRTLHAATFLKLIHTGNVVETLQFDHTFLRQRQFPLTSL